MTSSRRLVLGGAGALLAWFGVGALSQQRPDPNDYHDKDTADKWMQQWMQSLGAVTGALHVGRFADRFYFLTKSIEWEANPGQSFHKKVKVPVGFVTDFASIPRIFWSALPPDGQYTYPAILHDYLYWEQSIDRAEADLVFRYAMEEFNIKASTISAIHNGVRLGGDFAWKENAALKAAGEKRVIKVFPENPTVTWKEWKSRRDVF